jgi:hypothetical protein
LVFPQICFPKGDRNTAIVASRGTVMLGPGTVPIAKAADDRARLEA